MIDVVASCGCVLLVDQWSKRIVEIRPAARTRPSRGYFLRIPPIRNGSTTSKSNRNKIALVAMWLIAAAASLFLYYSGTRFQDHVGRIGIGSALGGAAGNLFDICERGFIVDFIDFRLWPVFNLADLAITAGLCLALWPGNH